MISHQTSMLQGWVLSVLQSYNQIMSVYYTYTVNFWTEYFFQWNLKDYLFAIGFSNFMASCDLKGKYFLFDLNQFSGIIRWSTLYASVAKAVLQAVLLLLEISWKVHIQNNVFVSCNTVRIYINFTMIYCIAVIRQCYHKMLLQKQNTS